MNFCNVIGSQGTGNSPLLVLDSNLTNVGDFNGSALTITGFGSIGIADSAIVLINGLVPFNGGNLTIDMQTGAAGSTANLQNLSGEFTVQNVDHVSDSLDMYFGQGSVIIDSSCTAGTIKLGGDVNVTDNSGVGCTVITTDVTGSIIWNVQSSEHAAIGTFGGDINTLITQVNDALGFSDIDGLTLEQTLAAVLATLAGKTVITDIGPDDKQIEFKSQDGTTTFVTGRVVAGERTEANVNEENM